MDREAGDRSSASVNGRASSPLSSKLDATENTSSGRWGAEGGRGWTTQGLLVFRLGKMKDASGNSSLGGRRGSAACLGACPEQPTLLFLSRADGDKLGKVKGRRLRGAFPERNSGSPASRSDLPTLHPRQLPRALLSPAVQCLGGVFQIVSSICLLVPPQTKDRGCV